MWLRWFRDVQIWQLGDPAELQQSLQGSDPMVALGIVLLVAGVVLALAEAHLTTGGLIGAIAAGAAIVGAVLLLLAAGVGAAIVLVLALCLLAAAASLLVLTRHRLLRPLEGRPLTGREALVGRIGTVRGGAGPGLQVFVNGSLWRAQPGPLCAEEPALRDGERVVVEGVDGLTLKVRRAEQWELIA